jgi:hypothetical protein
MVIAENYVFTKRLEIGEYFDAEAGAVTIELKETTAQNAAKFQKLVEDTERATAFFVDLLPSIIVDHDFWKDDAHKWEAKEVASIIANRAELCINLMGRYVSDVLFSQGRRSA